MKKRVVITGIGVISSIGLNKREFWKNCLEAKTNIVKIPQHWLKYADFNSKVWAPLPEVDFESYNINRIEQKKLDKSTMMALSATLEALNDAGLKISKKDDKNNTYYIENIDSKKASVFIGTGIGGVSTLGECFANQMISRQSEKLSKIIDETRKDCSISEDILSEIEVIKNNLIFPKRFNPFAVSMIMPNSSASNIAIKYSLNGVNNTFCSACASGTVAIGNAFKSIQNGESNFVISGGVEYFYDEYGALFYSFDVLKTLVNGEIEIDKINRPFDKERSGFLYSQGGVAILILEELEHATLRGANIYAEISGFSETCDGFNIMVPDGEGEKIDKMFYDLLKFTDSSPSEIDYINAHGTGTIINDEIETKIIEKIFGNKPLINSTKSLIGHTLGASGAIEAAVTALSIKNKTTHVCKNLENPIRDLNFVTKIDTFDIKKAITHSFGFGGHNAAILLKEF